MRTIPATVVSERFASERLREHGKGDECYCVAFISVSVVYLGILEGSDAQNTDRVSMDQ
jgi:hypothetical protein